LSRDLARSGRKSGARGLPVTPRAQVYDGFPADRGTSPTPTREAGQNGLSAFIREMSYLIRRINPSRQHDSQWGAGPKRTWWGPERPVGANVFARRRFRRTALVASPTSWLLQIELRSVVNPVRAVCPSHCVCRFYDGFPAGRGTSLAPTAIAVRFRFVRFKHKRSHNCQKRLR
jgi:hypothetical protein